MADVGTAGAGLEGIAGLFRIREADVRNTSRSSAGSMCVSVCEVNGPRVWDFAGVCGEVSVWFGSEGIGKVVDVLWLILGGNDGAYPFGVGFGCFSGTGGRSCSC